MENSISVRIPKEDLEEIEFLSIEEKRKKSDILRDVLYKGIMEKRLELALKKFQDNEATAWRAASIAGIPLTKFMEILASRKIEFHYGIEEFQDDVRDLI